MKFRNLKYKDGSLFWIKKEFPRQNTNKPIGFRDKDGYLLIGYCGKQYKVSRVVWEMHNGEIPNNKVVDHIDGDKTNNKISNLRLATKQENNMNRQPTGKTSPYKGVSKHKQSGKWQSRIMKDKKQTFIGLFDTMEEAAISYNEAAKQMFGKYAVINKII